MAPDTLTSRWGWRAFALALIVTALIYWPGLQGGWLFDDYPNIVDNHGVQPSSSSLGALVNAALSSPASDFKRPLASLSFAANYLVSGLDPFPMKLTNLVIHLLNGLLVFLLARHLFRLGAPRTTPRMQGLAAALVAAGWLLLPINLTSVLYVVQRMESMANVFVLLGLIGYIHARERLQQGQRPVLSLMACVASLVVPVALGALAKETAVMLPLYAFVLEWILFGFRRPAGDSRQDHRITGLFALILFVPLVVGLLWLLPNVLRPAAWATREFTLATRLLSEGRIVLDYVVWTIFPLPHELSFYHDDYVISTGWLAPWTTLASILVLAAMLGAVIWLRKRQPLIALGLAWFFACQLLTATIIPLELVYEHRNYFASLGLMLALVTLLVSLPLDARSTGRRLLAYTGGACFAGLLLWWISVTAMTAYAWGDPLALAQELARRGPESPRAQYELGRTYIIYSHYNPDSPYTKAAYAPLERAAALPRSSILPQQALIFMNARMGLPQKEQWWDSLIAKLAARPSGVQDDSSLGALAQCAADGGCDLPESKMTAAFEAALGHPSPSARLLGMYGQYAWNVSHDNALGLRMTARAAQAAPGESAYKITLVRMLVALNRPAEAKKVLSELESMNIGGSLDKPLAELRTLPGLN